MISTVTDQPKIDFNKLKQVLQSADGDELFQKIADAPFDQKAEVTFLFLGLISFFLVDKAANLVKLTAVSRTEQYEQSVNGYEFEPTEYQLCLQKDKDNDIVKAILNGRPQETTDWQSLSRRTADPEQARLNQAGGGIAYNAIYPLGSPAKGALLFCYFQYPENIGKAQQAFMKRYSQLVNSLLPSSTLVAKNLTALNNH